MDQPINPSSVLRSDNYNPSAEREYPDEMASERQYAGGESDGKALQAADGAPASAESGFRFTLGFKLLVISFVGSFLMMYRLFGIPTDSVPCIRDRAFEALAGVNQAANNDHQFGFALIISSSLCIDIFTLTMIGYWLIHGTSVRPAAVVLLFYVIRSFHLYMYTPKFPQGFFFQYPGFPSIMVPYGRQSDFFFSGHCGILTITTLEWHTLKKWKMFYPNLIALFYTAFVLMSLRVHYFIDISSGMVFAHWLFMLVSKNQDRLDSTLRLLQQFIGRRFQSCSLCKPAEVSPGDEEASGDATAEKASKAPKLFSA
jgi:hypothetical protein